MKKYPSKTSNLSRINQRTRSFAALLSIDGLWRHAGSGKADGLSRASSLSRRRLISILTILSLRKRILISSHAPSASESLKIRGNAKSAIRFSASIVLRTGRLRRAETTARKSAQMKCCWFSTGKSIDLSRQLWRSCNSNARIQTATNSIRITRQSATCRSARS